MKKYFSLFILSITITLSAQVKMKPVEELINTQEPGWELVSEWIGKARNSIEVLSVDMTKAKDALYKTQVTTRSPMGAIIYSTGGILIDSGWIRILGSGSSKLNRSLPEWNKGKAFKDFGEDTPYLLIADDAVGGFFMLNGGGLGADAGKIYYFAPDSLEYEPLDLSYSDFLNFCFNGNIEAFYEGMRWKNWKEDASKLDGDKVFNFVPMLWSKEGKDISKSSRRTVPIEEQYHLNLDFRKQLGLGE